MRGRPGFPVTVRAPAVPRDGWTTERPWRLARGAGPWPRRRCCPPSWSRCPYAAQVGPGGAAGRRSVGRSVARGLVRCLLSREGVGSFGAAAAARGLGLRRCEGGAVVPEPCRIGVRGRDAKAQQGLGSG